MKPILCEISTFRNFDGGPEFAEHAIYARFCIAALIFLVLTPTVTEVKRPDCVGYLPWFLG